jgi:hypothetical protein
MPTVQQQIERDSDTPGMTFEQMEFVFHTVCDALGHCCTQDHKQRHFMLMVITRDSVEADGSPVVTTDTFSSMNMEDVHQTMRDWLRMKTQ